MWKLFFKNLFLIPLKLITFALGFFVLMCFITAVFAIGTPAFILIGVGFFLWYCYWRAVIEQKTEKQVMLKRISICLDYIRKDFEDVEIFKNEFKELMKVYAKKYGEDSHYITCLESYRILIKEEN